MTKAFTALSILKLRDDGKLALDAPAETYIPEIKDWKYPTSDSPRIRVGHLLTHTAGFVTDDPWGDRQTPLPDEDFTRLLREGVPFTRPPAPPWRYSNLGYAMLGRIITNVARQPYKDYIEAQLLKPLGMASSGFEVTEAPAERRALGYRWEDGAWRLEPTMAHGAFGGWAGCRPAPTTMRSTWRGCCRRGRRETALNRPCEARVGAGAGRGRELPQVRMRPGRTGATACREAATYGKGMYAAVDCDLGLTLSHGGGYPGYGSHVLLLPDSGVGIFALANRTYAGPRAPVWDAAVRLHDAGLLKDRAVKADESLSTSYGAVGRMYAAGNVTSAGDVLAMNFLMDRSAEGWARDLASLKAQVGTCETSAPIVATGALSGEFTWRCEYGRIEGTLLMAPTRPAKIQALGLTRATP